ncbi:AmpG family muropeptide MFS transporter [Nitrosomonas sp. Is37]|uniref:AmpG family muropeptide MFS transporter n=1 Tax=Nitrosomonas sp. Is37 TaxID=3080535 RepID=UPI00294B23F3|nr:AmpG family muropeptide MFS transporter [Nitrosomonas sp. Is37]MDV6345197.1 AmpG family muropeptide MFS transporter [Nitrosomonas sp. Is37]
MINTTVAGWLSVCRIYMHPRVMGMLALGFSAGLPLLLILGTLSFWLREAGIDRATIGYLSWIGLAYGFKWMWSPLVDRLPLPLLTRLLGRRRAWLLLSQITITIALVGMASTDPLENLSHMIFFALAVAFASATQDIALDAYRIEAVELRLQGAMAATYQAGYRLAMILTSAGVLWIAASLDTSPTDYNYQSWRIAYLIMAACMATGIITTFIIQEPKASINQLAAQNEIQASQIIANWNFNARLTQLLTWLYGAMIAPFQDFIVRYGYHAILILTLIAIYRISDVVMGVMSNPFYVDMGYTKDEVATVSKVYGVIMTILGAAVGGLLIVKFGVIRTLFLGAVLSAATNLLFVWLSVKGHDIIGLIITISADNLSAGIASSAFVAYLSGLTNSAYSATQYALFSSVMLLIPKFIAGFSGQFVDEYGYALFFMGTTLLGLPVLILVWMVGRVELKTLISSEDLGHRS